jgi:GT2 family glycosyltransferase
MQAEIIEINTDNLERPALESVSLWANREKVYSERRKNTGDIKVTIVLQAYNRVEKLSYVLECLKKYTPDDLYELILVDNGSEPEVMELFKKVEHPRLKILRITKNLGGAFPQSVYMNYINGKYICFLSDDVYVTKNWLTNMLACLESDEKIGLVSCMSSNTSNYQTIDDHNDEPREKMQEFAAKFNNSDPTKWYQDVRAVTVMAIIKTEIYEIAGKFEPAFFHDFGEDDLCIRIRRNGYKIFICRDTFVYHDHNRAVVNDPIEFQKSLDSGRAIFKEKWGIDAWDDLLLDVLHFPRFNIPVLADNAKTLSVDPHMGKPVLVINNHMRSIGKNVEKSFAYTSDAKFYTDLVTVADEVKVGQIDNIRSEYRDKSFDIISVCEPLNTYPNPFKLLEDLCVLLKPNGYIIFHILNTFDAAALLRCFGITVEELPLKTAVNVTKEQCYDYLEKIGLDKMSICIENYETPEDVENLMNSIFEAVYKLIGMPFDEDSLSDIKGSRIHFMAKMK